MSKRLTLRSFPTVAACCAAIDTLHAEFKREFKRSATVSLCYSLLATPDPLADKPYYTKDIHSVSIHADDPLKQAAEIAWFERMVNTL